MSKLFILVICVFLFNDGNSGGPDDGIGGHENRDVDINTNSNGIQINSQSRTDTQNKVRIDIQTIASKALSARIRAFSHASGSGNNAVAHADFKVKFESLLEYQEMDGVPGFSGNDTAGTTINLGDESFSYSIVTLPPSTGNSINGVIEAVAATSTYFTVTCMVGGVLFNTSGVWTFTNSAKMDVDIQDFPYSGSLTNPRLALIIGVVTEITQFKAIQHDDTQPNADSDAVVVRSGGTHGDKTSFFSWVNTADVTAPPATVSVVAGPLTAATVDDDDDSSKDDKKTIVYSFLSLQPATVHWDPLIGVNTLSGVPALMPTFVVVAVLICSTLF